MNTFRTMLKTEWVLSVRDMNMPIFAVIMPLVIGAIMGMLYGSKPAFEGAPYTFLAQSFGAISAIGICAAGLMSLPLVLSDYRHRKILKRFKVTPVSPVMLLSAQVVVSFLMSLIAMIGTYGMYALFFGYQMRGSVIAFAGAFLLVSISIYSLGMLVASVSPNMKTANLLCTILYFPMLIFSGATLPYEIMPKGMKIVANLMPLTQGIKLLKATSLGTPIENMLLPLVVMSVVALVCIATSIRYFRWE